MRLRQTLRAPYLRRSLATGIVVLGLSAFSYETAQADAPIPAPGGLTLGSSIGETGSWSSNPLMATQGAKSLMGSTTTPEMILNDTTPTSLFNLDTRLDENIFDQSAFNSTDVHAITDLQTKNEHWTVGVKQTTDYDTTRTSELSNFGLAPVVTQHTGLGIAPQISYAPTSVDTLALNGSAASSHYDSNVFTNYALYSVTPSYTHAFDPLNSGILSMQAQRYLSTDNASIKIDSVGPSLGWQTTFGPRFSGNASIGAQTSRQYVANTAITPWTWQYIFGGGLTFRGEQDTTQFTASRSQFPYGNGTEALQTSYVLAEQHNLNSRFALNGDLTYLSSTYESTTLGSLKSLASVSGGVTYHATERLDLTATYQYRYETLTTGGLTAKDNTATVGLVYHPKLWTLLQ